MDPSAVNTDPRRQRSAEDFDIIIGFLGFWGLVLFLVTAVLEVTGKPALLSSMILLVVVLAVWGMLRLRRTLPARTARRPR
jgi:hypothetical protein